MKNKAIGTQDYLSVVMRVNTNWVEELWRLLGRDKGDVALASRRVKDEGDEGGLENQSRASEGQRRASEGQSRASEGQRSASELGTPQYLISKLKENEQRNLRTVLIFDQFEEFFFVYTEPAQSKQFFEFLGECLNVLSVKVILSLRVDYIHCFHPLDACYRRGLGDGETRRLGELSSHPQVVRQRPRV
ncbi:MAG TPA: hypothetical protein VE944_19935 [Nostoc sp.]|nr:hypothetical protein [Nostoc sp.]HYX16592.1 hypothetical protein [Nostoc sp.]